MFTGISVVIGTRPLQEWSHLDSWIWPLLWEAFSEPCSPSPALSPTCPSTPSSLLWLLYGYLPVWAGKLPGGLSVLGGLSFLTSHCLQDRFFIRITFNWLAYLSVASFPSPLLKWSHAQWPHTAKPIGYFSAVDVSVAFSGVEMSLSASGSVFLRLYSKKF